VPPGQLLQRGVVPLVPQEREAGAETGSPGQLARGMGRGTLGEQHLAHLGGKEQWVDP
jgi:hypothetical protein